MTKSTKSSKHAKLMGSQVPSERVVPEYDSTDGADAVKVIGAGGLQVDPWQSEVLNDWMCRDEEGIWAAASCGLSVPRQNGKTLNVIGRAAAGMILYGEWIIYTAHLQKTSTETFLEIKGLFETRAFARKVKEIKSAIGREQITLKNGGRIQFVARTRNGGRGLHGDCLIFDEAQELTVEQQGSFLPALSASRNPQTIYLGTPPDENADGTVFRGLRDKARNGESSTVAWTEFSVEDIGDVTDRSRWAATNPALGRRIRETTIASECEQMAQDVFARERLGWWTPIVTQKIDYALNHDAWAKCVSEETKPTGKTAYGVKFSADGTSVCLCGAAIPSKGTARISLIKEESTAKGIQWLANWLNERYTQASCVVIDGRNGVDLLIEHIAPTWKMKDSIIRPSAKDVIAAVSALSDAVNEASVSWYKYQERLNESATTAIKRPISGGFGFGGDNSPPIEACALAYWGARTSKRDPKRKMRIG